MSARILMEEEDCIAAAVERAVRSVGVGLASARHWTRPVHLGAREKQCLRLFLAGKNAAGVAAELRIAERTVDTYKERIYVKFNVHDMTELVRECLYRGYAEDFLRPARGYAQHD